MTTQAFDLPKTFDGHAPLFPLSGFVMFPSNLLPLHIFESRYREMMDHAVQGDRLIAMATLVPGYEHEYYSRPPIAPMVCIVRIIEYDRTPAGTYNLKLLGLRRAKVEYEIEPVRSFRRAKLNVMEDICGNALEALKRSAEQFAIQLRRAIPDVENLIQGYLSGEISLASLTDVLAFHLPLPQNVKLELLAESDVQLRVERLMKVLPHPTTHTNRYGAKFSAN